VHQYIRDYFRYVKKAYDNAGIALNQVLPEELYEICKTGAFAIMADRAEELNYKVFATIIREMLDQNVLTLMRIKKAWMLSEYFARKNPVAMWQDASGKQKPVTELDDGHLINIVRKHAQAIRLERRASSFWNIAQQVEAELPVAITKECKRRGINIELVLPYENVPKS